MAWQYGYTEITVWACIFTAFIISLTFIDADTQLLPDQLTIPLIWLGLLFNLSTNFIPLSSAVIGAVIGYMSLWLLFHIFKFITGKDGMGYGDFKMLAAIGAWLGVSPLPLVIFTSALIGIIAAVIKNIGKSKPMAFGPCLAISGWIIFVFYNHISTLIMWWLKKSGF